MAVLKVARTAARMGVLKAEQWAERWGACWVQLRAVTTAMLMVAQMAVKRAATTAAARAVPKALTRAEQWGSRSAGRKAVRTASCCLYFAAASALLLPLLCCASASAVRLPPLCFCLSLLCFCAPRAAEQSAETERLNSPPQLQEGFKIKSSQGRASARMSDERRRICNLAVISFDGLDFAATAFSCLADLSPQSNAYDTQAYESPQSLAQRSIRDRSFFIPNLHHQDGQERSAGEDLGALQGMHKCVSLLPYLHKYTQTPFIPTKYTHNTPIHPYTHTHIHTYTYTRTHIHTYTHTHIHTHTQEHGFRAADVPKAIVVHELLGIAVLALTWSTCYKFPPSQNRYLKDPIAKVMGLIPKKVSEPHVLMYTRMSYVILIWSTGILSSYLHTSTHPRIHTSTHPHIHTSTHTPMPIHSFPGPSRATLFYHLRWARPTWSPPACAS
jgi:hypothetical protein